MPSNTLLSDINEIYLGYELAGKKWFDPEAKKHFESRVKQVNNAKEVDLQLERARAMAKETIAWAKKAGYSGRIKKVWWTARPGVLARAVGQEVDSRKNPTDILVQFTSGPSKGFLGISAKATKGTGDIGFKNPGIGTVDAALKINLSEVVTQTTDKIVKKFKLPENTKARKDIIRSKPTIQKQTQEAGSKLLSTIRDVMYDKMKTLSGKNLQNYILGNWLDASNDLFPPYVKVTGMGNKIGNISAKVDDPLKNDKLTAVLKGPISLEKIGNESIGVKAGGKKILKMRAKFESEKLASSVKFSGDPY